MAVVGKGEKRGYVNKKGEVVIKLQFEEAESFSEGMASVILDGRSVIIGKTGKPSWSLEAFMRVRSMKVMR